MHEGLARHACTPVHGCNDISITLNAIIKVVCLQHAKETLALTALGGYTFCSDQNLLPRQKENSFIRNMNDQENLYSVLADYVC